MSEIKKIGMYSTDEILKHLTEGEGRGFLGRSMYDAIYFKIEELQNQLQQKENIIKEVTEKLNTQLAFTSSYQLNYQSAMSIIEEVKNILQGVDKN